MSTAADGSRTGATDDRGPAVRRATLDDVPSLTTTLVRAFAGYPWTDFAVPPDAHEERLRRSFAHYLDVTIGYLGEVWMTDDAASVAAWLRPDAAEPPPEVVRELGRVERETRGDRAGAVAAVEERLVPLRPTEPHWLLATMGTLPDRQGTGLATAVLRPVLDELDRVGMPAALETSALANVHFYERLGFQVTGKVEADGGAPAVWLMRREPAVRRAERH